MAFCPSLLGTAAVGLASCWMLPVHNRLQSPRWLPAGVLESHVAALDARPPMRRSERGMQHAIPCGADCGARVRLAGAAAGEYNYVRVNLANGDMVRAASLLPPY